MTNGKEQPTKRMKEVLFYNVHEIIVAVESLFRWDKLFGGRAWDCLEAALA